MCDVDLPVDDATDQGGCELRCAHAQPPEPCVEEPTDRVLVRYGVMHQTGEFRHSLERPPRPGQKLVLRTERGVEMGEVLAPVGSCGVSCQKLEEFLDENGAEFPFNRDGRVMRLANSQDLIDQRHLDGQAQEKSQLCRQMVSELKLQMKVVKVEHLLGGERIIFYFASERRVDFRELVRRLASHYRTRIEMRQVGARDEARLVGDYERCGQRCCCQQFLKDLRPVSMRMAKLQKATLDPSKISGRCGRLMCCLRYEDDGYRDLKKRLPYRNIWVRTQEGLVGRVVDGQVLTQLVRLQQADGTLVAVGVDEIVERDIPAPPPVEPPARSGGRSASRAPRPAPAPAPMEPVEAPAPGDDEPGDLPLPEAPDAPQEPAAEGETETSRPSTGRKRRRGRRRKGPQQDGSPQAPGAPAGGGGEAPSGQPSGQAPASGKRRRRRRKP